MKDTQPTVVIVEEGRGKKEFTMVSECMEGHGRLLTPQTGLLRSYSPTLPPQEQKKREKEVESEN